MLHSFNQSSHTSVKYHLAYGSKSLFRQACLSVPIYVPFHPYLSKNNFAESNVTNTAELILVTEEFEFPAKTVFANNLMNTRIYSLQENQINIFLHVTARSGSKEPFPRSRYSNLWSEISSSNFRAFLKSKQT